MQWWVYVILIIFGYFIYKGLSNKDDQPQTDSSYRRRKTGRVGSYTEERQKDSLIQSAQRQENMGNFDEASRLYLRAGQVFSAAKMKAMKGPQFARQAVEIIQVNSPERQELITRNLANDFFYRLEQPATSAALLRGLGLAEEAEAVEVAAGISVSQSYQEPAVAHSSAQVQSSTGETELEFSESELQPEMEEVHEEVKKQPTTPVDTYPNSMMMASSTQEDPCSVCNDQSNLVIASYTV